MKNLFLILLSLSSFAFSQNISPTLMGLGYWDTDHNKTDPNPVKTLPWSLVTPTGVKLVRIGGIGYNAANNVSITRPISPLRYVAAVDEVRKNGCEPVLTVPFLYDPGNPGQDFNAQVQISAANAKEIIRLVNIVHKRNVRLE